MKILVAEDNAVTATLMTGILTRAGHSVVLARNGSEALELLRSNSDIQGVITDIMMPEASGLDLLQDHQGRRNQRREHFVQLVGSVTSASCGDGQSIYRRALEGG